MSLLKPIKPKPKVTFHAEPLGSNGDTYGIRVHFDNTAGPWILWCDVPAGKCVTTKGIRTKDGVIPNGWAGAKSQAEIGAEQLQKLYDEGVIQ